MPTPFIPREGGSAICANMSISEPSSNFSPHRIESTICAYITYSERQLSSTICAYTICKKRQVGTTIFAYTIYRERQGGSTISANITYSERRGAVLSMPKSFPGKDRVSTILNL